MKNNNISRKDRLKTKRQAPANYLIVCEGKKTEPNYFNGLKKKINEKYGNKDTTNDQIEITQRSICKVLLVSVYHS